MASELDQQLEAIMAQITAPGAMLETATTERGGHVLPVFTQAPPSLPAFFEAFCARHGTAEFLVDADGDGGTRLTFAQAYALARRLAGGLVAGHGVRPGDRVGIAARNSANWVLAYMAIAMAGGCVTLVNAWNTGAEMADAIALVGCTLVLADPPRAARLDGHAHGAAVVTIEHGPPLTGLAALLARGGGEDTPLPRPGPDDIATVVYTSGSTGRAKGAFSDHRAVVHGALSFAAQSLMVLGYLTARGQAPTLQPCTLANVPLFHVTGEIPVFLQSFALGRRMVMIARWDAEEAMRLIERERVTYFVGVPLMSHEIATHPARGQYDLSSCITWAAGGAPRPAEHVARIRAGLPGGYPVLGYGLTETNGVGCGNFNDNYLAKPGSTGPASRPLVELAILDDAGTPLPRGETGEVAIRSVCNMTGYWNDPAATAAALMPDGFLRTGDMGLLDADGYLFIVDRRKDIIIRGGENISSAEVEQAIYGHPAVAEASVFSLPDARLGEVPGAVFLVRPGHALEAADLREYLAARIAAYKLPVRFWRETATLPRLGTEKVDKRALRSRYLPVWMEDTNSQA